MNLIFWKTPATTNKGKKVILLDDGTWQFDYSDNTGSYNSSEKECEKYEYGTIIVKNYKSKSVYFDLDHLMQLVNNPNYEQQFGNDTKQKKKWKDTGGDHFLLQPGETKKFPKVMSGVYTYRAGGMNMVPKYSSGNVEVVTCEEVTIEINQWLPNSIVPVSKYLYKF